MTDITSADNLYRPLLHLATPEDYKQEYLNSYCNQEIITHDGMKVKFFPEKFDHAFYKSCNRRIEGDKSVFSPERAQRMHWIRAVLEDASLSCYQGYDRKKRRYDSSRRVAIVTPDNYVVVISLRNANSAVFVTAYLCDDNDKTINKIRQSPTF